MSLSYIDVDTVISDAPVFGFACRVITALGFWCYPILTEDPATADHARRVSFVRMIFSRRTSLDMGQQRVYARNVVPVLLNQGLSDSSSDADIQAATNAVMVNLLAGYQQ